MNPFRPTKKIKLLTGHTKKSVVSILRDENFFESPTGLLPGFQADGSFTLKQAFADIYSNSVVISGRVEESDNRSLIDIELKYQGEMYIGYYVCICAALLATFHLDEIAGVILLIVASVLILIMVLYQELLIRMKAKEIENVIISQLREKHQLKRLDVIDD